MYRYLFVYVFWTAFVVHSLRREEEEEEKGAKYEFEFDVQDPKTGNFQSRQEERQADVLRGQYSLQDPDGVRRTVVYKVDGKSGFVATVHRERTDDCGGCGYLPTPFMVEYRIKQRSPDSYVNSYFYMGGGLAASTVQVNAADGAQVLTRTRHPAQHVRHY